MGARGIVDAGGIVLRGKGAFGSSCAVGYDAAARVGDGVDGAVQVRRIGVCGVLGNAAGGARVGDRAAHGVVAPCFSACGVAHASPAADAVGDGEAVVTGLVVEIARNRGRHRAGLCGVRLTGDSIQSVVAIRKGDRGGAGLIRRGSGFAAKASVGVIGVGGGKRCSGGGNRVRFGVGGTREPRKGIVCECAGAPLHGIGTAALLRDAEKVAERVVDIERDEGSASKASVGAPREAGDDWGLKTKGRAGEVTGVPGQGGRNGVVGGGAGSL